MKAKWVLMSVLLGVALLTSKAMAQDVDDGEEDVDGEEEEEVAQPAGGAPPQQRKLTPEQEEMNRQFQMQLTQHLLETVTPSCKEEIEAVLKASPEQQSQSPFTPECDAEVRSQAQAFQQEFLARNSHLLNGQQQQGEGAEGAEGQQQEGGEQQEAAAASQGSALGVVATVLLFVTVVGGALTLVARQRSAEKTKRDEEMRAKNPKLWDSELAKRKKSDTELQQEAQAKAQKRRTKA